MMTADAWIMFVLGAVIGSTTAVCVCARLMIRDVRDEGRRLRAEGRRLLATLRRTGNP